MNVHPLIKLLDEKFAPETETQILDGNEVTIKDTAYTGTRIRIGSKGQDFEVYLVNGGASVGNVANVHGRVTSFATTVRHQRATDMVDAYLSLLWA